MPQLLLASLILMATADVEVQLVDGTRVEGRLTAMDARRVVLDTADGNRALSLNELMRLEPSVAPRPAEALPEGMVHLIDGSMLRCEQFNVSQGQAEIATSLGPVVCSTDAIRAVRFVAANGTTLDEWNRLLGETFNSDVLVVARGESLNFHRGITREVTDETVSFELDGDVLKVKRSKVFGLIYYHPSGIELPKPVAVFDGVDGSCLPIHAVTLDGKMLHITTPSGVSVDCPFDELRWLDFSKGKIVYLGQLKPRSAEWTPFIELAKELPSRKAFFAPLHDPLSDGSAMNLGGKRYTRGIALYSRTELKYDLPEGYRRLKAIVGIDDAFRPRGNAELVIRANGRVLFEDTIAGTKPPKAIDLDVAGAKRLTILVDFGQDMDLGDHVDLCEARLVK